MRASVRTPATLAGFRTRGSVVKSWQRAPRSLVRFDPLSDWVVVPARRANAASQLGVPGEEGRFVQPEPGHAAPAVMPGQGGDGFGREVSRPPPPAVLRIHVKRFRDGQRLAPHAGRLDRLVDGRPRAVAAVPVAVDDGVDQSLGDPLLAAQGELAGPRAANRDVDVIADGLPQLNQELS